MAIVYFSVQTNDLTQLHSFVKKHPESKILTIAAIDESYANISMSIRNKHQYGELEKLWKKFKVDKKKSKLTTIKTTIIKNIKQLWQTI